ncbi:MAG TPA: 2-oxoacid:acceptor oxidoreductase subunit alpha [Alphaproteobacteria bacterium]|jgi:2-oxoglutarate ferredoxin oxidoreductase subunit alpha
MEGGNVGARARGDRREIESAVIRFAGDSGDGMQLTGSQFTQATALARNDLATFPDFPAEIRAPVGTTFGVSAYQINFGARTIKTAGDELDVLVAMNPAALKVNVKDVKRGGLVIVDVGEFTEKNFRKCGYTSNPLEDGTLDPYKTLKIDMSRLTLESVAQFGLGQKDGLRCKNMWALGLVYWMYGRDPQVTIDWLKTRFAKNPTVAEANVAALKAGHAFGETSEMPAEIGQVIVPAAPIQPGLYRALTGTEAVAWGLVVGARLAGLPMVFAGYPITPASALLHVLAALKEYDVLTFQAEDEIAAACAAIGASYAGALGVTSSSGPGVALKTEALGLAIATELPLVLINSQRGGPSTGLPTKTEQSDLYQAVWGRNADAPLAVLAANSPGDAFEVAIEAVRIAVHYMTPVILLTDGYIANASEPWRIPDVSKLKPFPAKFRAEPAGFHPFLRDDRLVRNWAKPGTPGLMHRIGGIEKDYNSGNISYEPENHQKMTDVRRNRILNIAKDIPLQGVEAGNSKGRLAVVGWGSTYGPISRAVDRCREDGLDVSHIHLRYIWPLPRNLGELFKGFDQVIVPEMNDGQLVTLLRAQYLVPAQGLNKVTGKPFKISEIEVAIRDRLAHRQAAE